MNKMLKVGLLALSCLMLSSCDSMALASEENYIQAGAKYYLSCADEDMDGSTADKYYVKSYTYIDGQLEFTDMQSGKTFILINVMCKIKVLH